MNILVAAAACGLAAGAAHAAEPAAARPNIVLVLTDDQGWGDLSVHGNTNLATPRIHSLARDGALFERFYVSPVCSPTRAALLTGRYPSRTGVTGVTRGAERMRLDETTLADVFKSAGYATALFGKWHNGSQYPYHPNGRGFEMFYGFCCGHWGHYFDPLLERNGEEVRGQGFIADDLTDKALDFIASSKDRPFLCYLAFNTPHSPFQVPDRDFAKFRDAEPAMRHDGPEREEIPKTRAALALCENVDRNVGRILDRLDAAGLRERTIVLYLSDNGPNSWRWNGGMKGRKGGVDEGGVRVPFLVRWPGAIPAGKRVDRVAAHIDVLPTLAALAGVPLKTAQPLDGVSLKPLLAGDGAGWPDRMLFTAWGNRVSVRTQRHRADEKALYDMTADPGQKVNVASKQPDVHAALVEAIRRFRADAMTGGAREESRPCPVGHKAFPRTVLPAQECVFNGKDLRFSSIHPNSAWIAGWTGTNAHPAWDIEVATAGTYEVTLRYTCPPADAGSEVEVAYEGRTLRGRVAEGYDPPLLEANDRVPRDESYEKPFRDLRLGEIELPAGRGWLRVRALSVPGKTVMDLRAVVMKLKT